jgi:hypothetical protein
VTCPAEAADGVALDAHLGCHDRSPSRCREPANDVLAPTYFRFRVYHDRVVGAPAGITVSARSV